ncbi:MAG: hypothetical protein ACWA5Q_01430 [bacterium]
MSNETLTITVDEASGVVSANDISAKPGDSVDIKLVRDNNAAAEVALNFTNPGHRDQDPFDTANPTLNLSFAQGVTDLTESISVNATPTPGGDADVYNIVVNIGGRTYSTDPRIVINGL